MNAEMPVKFVSYRRQSNLIDCCDSFAFRKDKRFHAIQRICLWILRRIGCYRQREDVTYSTITVNPEDFMDRLLTQRRELQANWNLRPKRILVGYDDYEEIMQIAHSQQGIPGKFAFEASYCVGYKIYGLTVEVIPWMKGVLVMP